MIEVFKSNKISAIQFQQINNLWNQEYPVRLKDRFHLFLTDYKEYFSFIKEKGLKGINSLTMGEAHR